MCRQPRNWREPDTTWVAYNKVRVLEDVEEGECDVQVVGEGELLTYGLSNIHLQSVQTKLSLASCRSAPH